MLSPYYEQVNGVIDMLAQGAAQKRAQAAANKRWLTEQQLEQQRFETTRQDQMRSESIKHKLDVLSGWAKDENVTPEFKQRASESMLNVLNHPDTVLSLKPEYGDQAPLLPPEVVDHWKDVPQISDRIKQGRLTEKQAKILSDIYFKQLEANQGQQRVDAYGANLKTSAANDLERLDAYKNNITSMIDERNIKKTGKDNEPTVLNNLQDGLVRLRQQLMTRLTYSIPDEEKEQISKRIEGIDRQLDDIYSKMSTKAGVESMPEELFGFIKQMQDIASTLDGLKQQ